MKKIFKIVLTIGGLLTAIEIGGIAGEVQMIAGLLHVYPEVAEETIEYFTDKERVKEATPSKYGQFKILLIEKMTRRFISK